MFGDDCSMIRCPSFSLFPSATLTKGKVFIRAGRKIKSAARHARIVTAHSRPAVRTGTNYESKKIRNAAISIRLARTIGLPVMSSVCHIGHPSSSLPEPLRSETH